MTLFWPEGYRAPLTEPQLDYMLEAREHWLTKLLNGWDTTSTLSSPSDVSEDLAWLYETSHLNVPQTVAMLGNYDAFAESLATRIVRPGSLVGSAIESGAWARSFDEREIRRVLHQSSIDAARMGIRERLATDSRRLLNALSVRSQVFRQLFGHTDATIPSFGILRDGPWIAYLDYFRRLRLLNNPDFERYTSFMMKGIFALVCYERLAVICLPPKEMHLDDRKRPHSMSQSAIKWPDGAESYYLHGVRFNQDQWKKVTERKLSTAEIIRLRNSEQRTVAMQIFGYDEILKSLHAKVIDKRRVKHDPSGRILSYEVLEVDLPDHWRPARFVKVECPSTGRGSLLRVDPSVPETAKVEGAVAWTFGLRPEEYDPELET